MLWSVFEGLGLGALLFVYCLIGIKDGAVGMVFLYDKKALDRCVELGLTSYEKVKKRAIIFKISGIVLYTAYVLVFAYTVNGARGFLQGFFANAYNALYLQRNRQDFRGRNVGLPYEDLDNPRDGRSYAVYTYERQS